MNNPEDKFTENICKVLDRSLDDLDSDTLTKIGQLKYRALDSAQRNKSRKLFWSAIPATCVAILLVFLLNGLQQEPLRTVPTDFTALNILTAGDSLEFYTEDIEFYEWLSEVLENEPEINDQHSDLFNTSGPGIAMGTGEERRSASQFGVDRISRGVRG